MYIIHITNLENYSREVQYYRINKYMVVAPKKTIEIKCNDADCIGYYNSLKNKKFKVDIIETNVPKLENPFTSIQKSEPVAHVVNEFKADVADTHHEDVKETIEPSVVEEKDTAIEETANKSLTIEDLSNEQLKQVLKNLGVSTSARARQKLVDLVALSLPDNTDLSTLL